MSNCVPCRWLLQKQKYVTTQHVLFASGSAPFAKKKSTPHNPHARLSSHPQQCGDTTEQHNEEHAGRRHGGCPLWNATLRETWFLCSSLGTRDGPSRGL